MATLGIDISKATFDATLIDDGRTRHHQQFANTAAGFHQLTRWLRTFPVTTLHACMEATNIYWEDLAEYLVQQGYRVSVVNPARTKGFAMSQLQRNKTDNVDSGSIADFCERLTPSLWTPPRPESRQLRDLVRHVDGLKKTKTQHLNRLHTCRNPVVQQSLRTIIETLEAQIRDMETQMTAIFTTHAELKAQRTRLLSIPGIGATTAAKILAEMPDLDQYQDARAAAADAGLTPSHYESGVSVRRRPRLSKVGKASIRGALYWPAITAMQHNPIMRTLKERLEHRGKQTHVIVGAVMRKRLHLAYGVLKHQRSFDPQYVRHSNNICPADICQST
jgi:transposase